MQDRADKLVGGKGIPAVKYASAATGVRIYVPGKTDDPAADLVFVEDPSMPPSSSAASNAASSSGDDMLPKGGFSSPLDVLLEGPFASVKACFGLLIEPVLRVGGPAKEHRELYFPVPGDLVAPLIGESRRA